MLSYFLVLTEIPVFFFHFYTPYFCGRAVIHRLPLIICAAVQSARLLICTVKCGLHSLLKCLQGRSNVSTVKYYFLARFLELVGKFC